MNDSKISGGTEEFVDGIVSTESIEENYKIKYFFSMLRDTNVSQKDKVNKANEIIKYLNKASKNLLPGHSSPNQAPKEHRDAHLVREEGNYTEIPHSQNLSKSFNKFIGGTYESRKRATSEGKIEYQSSSLHKDADKAWYTKYFTNLQ